MPLDKITLTRKLALLEASVQACRERGACFTDYADMSALRDFQRDAEQFVSECCQKLGTPGHPLASVTPALDKADELVAAVARLRSETMAVAQALSSGGPASWVEINRALVAVDEQVATLKTETGALAANLDRSVWTSREGSSPLFPPDLLAVAEAVRPSGPLYAGVDGIRLNEAAAFVLHDTPLYGRCMEALAETRTRLLGLIASDEAAWAEAQEENRSEEYESYLRAFPAGKRAAEAKAKLEDFAWGRAATCGTKQAIDSFLAAWPDSRHLADARTILQQCRAKRRKLYTYAAAGVGLCLVFAFLNASSQSKLDRFVQTIAAPGFNAFDATELALKGASFAPWHAREVRVTLNKLNEKRTQAAQAARAQATLSRESARQAQAEPYGGGAWQKAEEKLKAAEVWLASGRFAEAQAGFAEAGRSYEEARNQAVAVIGYLKAKGEYEKLAADRTTVDLLRRHGGAEWQNVQHNVEQAVAFGERKAQEGAAQYEAAAKAWPGAVKAAEVRAEITEHLLEAQKAEVQKEWIGARAAAERVLALEAGHADASALLERIKRNWRPESATQNRPWANSLGMKFVPVPGTKAIFSIWDSRVKDYAAYAGANSGVDGSWRNPGFAQEDAHPVVNVSWEDAKAFCRWLTEKERSDSSIGPGQEYRLPTDAEWNVAVGLNEEAWRTPKEKDGNGEGVYPWGSQWPPPRGAGNYGSSLHVDDYENTSPVGSFQANRYGLYDMGGNVWQWCEDYYDGQSGNRVLRGGSWRDGDPTPAILRSACRGDRPPGFRGDYLGFRCVWVEGSSP